MLCPRGHALEDEIVDEVGRRCDSCKHGIRIGQKIWSCELCDHDVCDVCYGMFSERPRSVRVGTGPVSRTRGLV